jgi:hypothetical protein
VPTEVKPPAATPAPGSGPVAAEPVQTGPPVAEQRRSSPKREYPPRTCEQCGNDFVPEHHRSKICGDECRQQRARDRLNGIKKTFTTTTSSRAAELKRDAEEVQNEVQMQALAEKFAPSHARQQLGSNPQAAPRMKYRRVKLAPLGGYAPVGSPEATAAIERVKAEARATTTE